MENVIVVAAHPDDETLGCGGTLLKHKADGDKIYWLILTNVDEKYGWSKERVESRQKEIQIVSKIYGFSKVIKLDFPTTKLDTVPLSDIIFKISEIFKEVKPQIVYLPNKSDVHSDHEIVFKTAYSCTKNFRYPFIKRVLMYETLSETEFSPALSGNAFVPNVFIDITDFMNKKLEIMSEFASEVMPDNLPRSYNATKALAAFRGSRIGVNYAETFTLLFENG